MLCRLLKNVDDFIEIEVEISRGEWIVIHSIQLNQGSSMREQLLSSLQSVINPLECAKRYVEKHIIAI